MVSGVQGAASTCAGRSHVVSDNRRTRASHGDTAGWTTWQAMGRREEGAEEQQAALPHRGVQAPLPGELGYAGRWQHPKLQHAEQAHVARVVRWLWNGRGAGRVGG